MALPFREPSRSDVTFPQQQKQKPSSHGHSATDQHCHDATDKQQRQHANAAANNNNNGIPQPTSALALLKQQQQQQQQHLYLLLHHPSIHNHGIVPLSLGITEIFGTAGSGKTQMGLSLCVSTVVHDTTTTALYVSLGSTQPGRIASRLQQMACHRNHAGTTTTTTTTNHNNNADSSSTLLQRILTKCVRNEDDFLQFVLQELPTMLLLSCPTIRVVVLDSIANLFRGNDENDDGSLWLAHANQRSSTLFRIAAQLKFLSERYNIPILVINQVSHNLQTNTIVPALGLSWASCVNASYQIAKLGVSDSTGPQQQQQTTRSLTLVRSSSTKTFTTLFRIDTSGVVAVVE